MKFIITIILTAALLFSPSSSKAVPDDLINSYLESMFACKYNYTRKVLATLKKNHYDHVRSKLAFANFYMVMYETSGEEEKYHVLCRKEANNVVDLIKKKDNLTEEDVYYLVSAKSILLKIQFMKKNYLKVAGDIKSIIKQFEYALDHESNAKMKIIAGMYNYYIETAKEDYPIIYPMLMFYPKGNKEKGLKQIKASTKVEEKAISVRSLLYLARIYDKDEKNIEMSKFYYKKLLSMYPDNLYWRNEYIKALGRHNKHEEAKQEKLILSKNVKKSIHLTDEQRTFYLNY